MAKKVTRWSASILVILLVGVIWYRYQPISVPDDEWIAKAWVKTMQSYQIKPVYPPTEDIHVGDIYGIRARPSVIQTNKSVGETKKEALEKTSEQTQDKTPEQTPEKKDESILWNAIKIDHASLVYELNKYYNMVPNVTQDSHESASQLTASNTGKKTSALPKTFWQTNNVALLPIMVFPTFSTNSADRANVSAGLLGKLSGWMRLSGNRSSEVSMRIQEGYTYGVPAVQAYNALDTYCQDKDSGKNCDHLFVRDLISNLSEKNVPDLTKVAIVSRVFLAKRIEYSSSDSRFISSFAGVGTKLDSVLKRQNVILQKCGLPTIKNEVSSKNKLISSESSEKEIAPDPEADAKNDQLAKQIAGCNLDEAEKRDMIAMQRSLQEAMNNMAFSMPSLSQKAGMKEDIQIGALSENSITLVQTFARPVVVGYLYVTRDTNVVNNVQEKK
ncbi:hypothetical protein ABC383_22745 [Noviherbaspirillum sp. 1P10PC]|uniref:hypothetical protein n=1 Tax=Noviherbaspirillum sp. 1P10PC TaxID=3132292 RepID=UPI0039A36043